MKKKKNPGTLKDLNTINKCLKLLKFRKKINDLTVVMTFKIKHNDRAQKQK